MAKKKRRPPAMRGPVPKGGQGLLAQVQKMQEEMAQAQEALAEETLTVTAGGGAVTITITGDQHIERVEVDPDLLDPEEREMLQDLLVAAFNQALEQAKELAAQRIGTVTSGLDVPGLGDLGI
jgi:DNA-binding YbaB/EbfC family protein